LPFAILGSAAVNAFARRLGLTPGLGLLSALTYLMVPIVVTQSGMQLTDVLGGGVLMATFALACAPVTQVTYKRLGFIGLGIGLTATSKLALLPGAMALGVFAIGSVVWRGGSCTKNRIPALHFTVAALVFFMAVAPWWIRNMVRYGNPVYPAALPLIGRGILETDRPMKDTEFVPSPAAWPIYPLIERHNEYSGFGPLLTLGLIPGLILAFLRGRRRAFSLYVCTAVAMFAVWWMLTRHEPRFLLPIFGLGFAFIPWALLALTRKHRSIGSRLFAFAGIYSGLVTLDQALIHRVSEPTTRTEFYDQVWGVDPFLAVLPETEGILHHTGYASYTYVAYYSLLGRSLKRVVVPVDGYASNESIIGTMRTAGLRYAYVTASPEFQRIVERTYYRSQFALEHASTVSDGWRRGTRRYLYRLK